MAEESMCMRRRAIEEPCKKTCATAWTHYEECAKRITSYDSWSLQQLQNEYKRRGEPYVNAKTKQEISREALAENLKGAANCEYQYLHYFECIDKCVIPKLGAQLK